MCFVNSSRGDGLIVGYYELPLCFVDMYVFSIAADWFVSYPFKLGWI